MTTTAYEIGQNREKESILIAKTPCCGKTVHLLMSPFDIKWTRHCMAQGCRKIYDITRARLGELVWTERRHR